MLQAAAAYMLDDPAYFRVIFPGQDWPALRRARDWLAVVTTEQETER